MAKSKKAPSPAAEAVAAAQLKVDGVAQELAAARAEVERLEADVVVARAALRDTRVAADAELPQCRMVSVRRFSGIEDEAGRVVILKKTPGGTLVVRRVGNGGGPEYRFKWSAHRAKFVQMEKYAFFGSDTRELRDVPTEFLPTPSQGTAP